MTNISISKILPKIDRERMQYDFIAGLELASKEDVEEIIETVLVEWKLNGIDKLNDVPFSVEFSGHIVSFIESKVNLYFITYTIEDSDNIVVDNNAIKTSIVLENIASSVVKAINEAVMREYGEFPTVFPNQYTGFVD